MLSLDERARYEPDSGVAWSLLPILLVGSLAAAAGVAYLLKFAFVHGWYLLMLMPALGGVALGGALFLLVGWAHCRNRWLAGTVGAVAGAAAFLGYYQFCFMDFLPPGSKWRVDLLPRYIAFRMKTDVAREVGKPNAGQQAKPVAPLNWIMFGCELLVVTGLGAACAWARARRAYSPELSQWMHREVAMLPPGAALVFPVALEAGQLPEFIRAARSGSAGQAPSRLVLEYATPPGGSAFEFPVFASVDNLPQLAKGARPPRKLPRQVELEPEEVLALRPLFPHLTQVLAVQHAELRDLPAEPVPAPDVEAPARELAEITPVPEPYRQRVRSRGYAVKVNLLGLIPLVFFLGGAGLVAWGVLLILGGSVALGCALAVVGAGSFAWGVYTAIYCLGVFENRWIERRVRKEIGQRPDALVDAQSPEAVFVSLIPRESFVKIKWTMASDLLLLKIDPTRRQLLMEGDADRYRIPAGAITDCEPQCFFHPIDPQHKNEFWMARLLVQAEEGPRELLLSVGNTRFSPMTNPRRRQIAEHLCRRINALRG